MARLPHAAFAFRAAVASGRAISEAGVAALEIDEAFNVGEGLARFPLSIILLAGRVGVGSVFCKAGLLKYNSPEFTSLCSIPPRRRGSPWLRN